GVAAGFAKENHGAAALAGGIGYLILTAVLKSINDKIDMGVLAGILCGIVAGNLYNRFKDIKLPEYLAFFGGKRFVPIITGLKFRRGRRQSCHRGSASILCGRSHGGFLYDRLFPDHDVWSA